MATDKQINANRLNAQKSTGPKSPEGKKRVARNNMKHGLAGEHVVLSTEDQSSFDLLLSGLMDEWNPQTETEAFLVESMAHNEWRLRRCMRLEKAAFERQIKANAGTPLFDTPMAVDDITRYEGRSSRAYYRALDTLRKLQAERAKQAPQDPCPEPEPVEAAPAAAGHDHPQPQQSKAAHPQAEPLLPIGCPNPFSPPAPAAHDPLPEAA